MEGTENKPALWKNSPTRTYFKYLVLFQYLGSKSYFTWQKQTRADCAAHSLLTRP